MKILAKILSLFGVVMGLFYLFYRGISWVYDSMLGRYTVFDDEEDNVIHIPQTKEEDF